MPRWKTTQDILTGGEFFDDNWMNFDRIWQYAPKPKFETQKTITSPEKIDLWEVIVETSGHVENSGFFGVYAAYQPYCEYYVVTFNKKIIKEFFGVNANRDLEIYLKKLGIPYPEIDDSEYVKTRINLGIPT
jgi:hypothetical protein